MQRQYVLQVALAAAVGVGLFAFAACGGRADDCALNASCPPKNAGGAGGSSSSSDAASSTSASNSAGSGGSAGAGGAAQACSSGGECASGHCADGFCCDLACTGA